jgi:hypothetical protein
VYKCCRQTEHRSFDHIMVPKAKNTILDGFGFNDSFFTHSNLRSSELAGGVWTICVGLLAHAIAWSCSGVFSGVLARQAACSSLLAHSVLSMFAKA